MADKGLEVNEEGNDISQQDRLQDSGHTAPEGESRPPLVHEEEKSSSQKTPHIIFPLSVTIKDDTEPQVLPFPMTSPCQGTPRSTECDKQQFRGSTSGTNENKSL